MRSVASSNHSTSRIFFKCFSMLQMLIRCPLGKVSRPTPTCAICPCCRCCSFSCARYSTDASYSSFSRSGLLGYLELDRRSHARQSLDLSRRITDHTPVHTHGATSRMVPSNGREWVGFELKLRTTPAKQNTRKRQSIHFIFCVGLRPGGHFLFPLLLLWIDILFTCVSKM
jgi:hypothetical protein